MLFNSVSYVLFLLIAVIATSITPNRFRVYLFGMFGLIFYAMWRWEFIFLLVFTTGVDFLAAKLIYRIESRRQRKALLVCSLTINLGLLVFFKYSLWLYGNLQFVALALHLPMAPAARWGLDAIVLPLGISFYTFHSISYVVDVYRGVTIPARHYGIFLTYVTFWPQLVAGPILRANEVISQLEAPGPVRFPEVGAGLERVLIGLFKKVVIVDSLGAVVDLHFADNHLEVYSGWDVWVMCFLFGFQIYFDFSGYSDIAIGSARMIGLKFPENFNWPYLAVSPRDFWRRWHISLSSWVRDYLYAPLTGQAFHTDSLGGIAMAADTGARQRTWALFVTWAIMGLWHGAAWTFVCWGLYHAVVIFLFREVPGLRGLPHRFPTASWAITLPVIMAGWIAFRADSTEKMALLYAKMLNPFSYTAAHQIPDIHYIQCLLLSAGIAAAYGIQSLSPEGRYAGRLYAYGKVGLYAVIGTLVITFLRSVNQFIYFQF